MGIRREIDDDVIGACDLSGEKNGTGKRKGSKHPIEC